jgi:hypothetical protein
MRSGQEPHEYFLRMASPLHTCNFIILELWLHYTFLYDTSNRVHKQGAGRWWRLT